MTRDVELYQQIAQALVAIAPVGWERLSTVYREAGKMSEWQNNAFMPGGRRISIGGNPPGFADALEDLRAYFYQTGKGAWYTARCEVTSEGKISFDFDYDHEPEWRSGVVPLTYVEDLEIYPRDEADRPAWLREKVRQAAKGPADGI